jgi:hypothetical protein
MAFLGDIDEGLASTFALIFGDCVLVEAAKLTRSE